MATGTVKRPSADLRRRRAQEALSAHPPTPVDDTQGRADRVESGPKHASKPRGRPSSGGSLALLLGRFLQPVLTLSHPVAVAPMLTM